jgi:hypothetical protein
MGCFATASAVPHQKGSNNMNAADFAPIAAMVDDVRQQGGHGFRANLLIEVATLELLIEKGIITADEAIARINGTRHRFLELFGDKAVGMGADWAIDILQGRTPLHGSIIEKAIQQKARDQA